VSSIFQTWREIDIGDDCFEIELFIFGQPAGITYRKGDFLTNDDDTA